MKTQVQCWGRITLSLAALGCWLVMFLAGTDVWHAAGSPDVWHLPETPYPDVRAFLWAYYGLLVVLLAHLGVAVLGTFGKRARQC